MSTNHVKLLQAAGFFSSMDVQMAGLVSRMYPDVNAANQYAAALASRAISQGHACVDLTDYAGKAWNDILNDYLSSIPDYDNSRANEGSPAENNYTGLGKLPNLSSWTAALKPALFGSGHETGGQRTLFVRKGTRIYLRRYWDYERKVESALTRLNCESGNPVDEKALNRYFKDSADNEQKQAAAKAAAKKLSLLSGGPGTGKTYTLARVVALLAEMHSDSGTSLHVRMVAPTGKAAVRMMESIQNAKKKMLDDGVSTEVLDAVPEDATTIHRLLGASYNSPYFKHDSQHPVAADMVIVDEASMVDLPLMAKLLDALPQNCALMLVGDIDQLASVEPGRVYGDVCRAAENGGPLDGCLTRLTKSRRFPEGSAIGTISRLINSGEAEDAWNMINGNRDSVNLQVLDSGTLSRRSDTFINLVKEQLTDFVHAVEPGKALAAADNFRILCAMREGPYGVRNMNRQVEDILSGLGLAPGRRFYDHQMIMIKVNTPALNLFNGDVGVILKEGLSNELRAWFPDKDKGVRAVPVSLLPEHETAFAMTIHKSQGSEFPYIALVLPDAGESPVLSRELLYTGITRVRIDEAKQTGKLVLWCTEESFKSAVNKTTARATGLFHPEPI